MLVNVKFSFLTYKNELKILLLFYQRFLQNNFKNKKKNSIIFKYKTNLKINHLSPLKQ